MWVIRCNLLFSAAVILVHNFIMTHLDYCNPSPFRRAKLPAADHPQLCHMSCTQQAKIFSYIGIYARNARLSSSCEVHSIQEHHAGMCLTCRHCPGIQLCVPVTGKLGQWSSRFVAYGDMQVLNFCTSIVPIRSFCVLDCSLRPFLYTLKMLHCSPKCTLK